MEPVHGGRDDPRSSRRGRHWLKCRNGARPRRTGRPPPRGALRTQDAAAMEPVHGGRDDPLCARSPIDHCRPQWSPSTEDGTTRPGTPPRSETPGRNGARPRRTGRPAEAEWSAREAYAAMEPVHGGRDDVSATCDTRGYMRPQWSPSTEDGTTARKSAWLGRCWCRNGARPRRTGRHAPGSDPARRRSGRNGARPRRTGRQPFLRVEEQLQKAAMEPVHGGRDDESGQVAS